MNKFPFWISQGTKESAPFRDPEKEGRDLLAELRIYLKNPPLRKLIGRALGICAILAVMAVPSIVDFKLHGPAATRVESELNKELSRIHPPAQSTLQDSNSSSKPRIAFVGVTYSTTLSYEDARAFHDSELSSQGWTYVREKYWGQSTTRCYSKGEYWADVKYEVGLFGGRTIHLGMSWGLGICDD